jgi:hypothetical protein
MKLKVIFLDRSTWTKDRKTDNTMDKRQKDRKYNGQMKKDRQYNGQMKDRQYNGQMKKDTGINMSCRYNTTLKTKERTNNIRSK